MSAATKRRWYQFSLVILLAIIVLAAASIGLWRAGMQPTDQQRQVARRIEPPPANVNDSKTPVNESSGTKQPRVRLPRGADTEEQIDLTQSGFTDADMEQLPGMSQLRILKLSSTSVGNKGLMHLQQLPRLERLWLNSTRVTNEGLDNLRRMTELKELWLSGTFVSDLKPLEKLEHLAYLECAGTQITDEGLAPIQGLSNLEVLWINSTKVTDKGLIHL